MKTSSFDLLLGEYLLLSEGLPAINRHYVELVGFYYRRLLNLGALPEDKRIRLKLLYSRELKSSKFWASYDGDVEKMTNRQKQHIFIKKFGRRCIDVRV